ncbi:MAG: tetratricopeptide repeat protein [Candidatus Wallbacteria bacterium]|nr:tetratricopeptide repeat protein [Candidatus Wallbacteria bacterium]
MGVKIWDLVLSFYKDGMKEVFLLLFSLAGYLIIYRNLMVQVRNSGKKILYLVLAVFTVFCLLIVIRQSKRITGFVYFYYGLKSQSEEQIDLAFKEYCDAYTLFPDNPRFLEKAAYFSYYFALFQQAVKLYDELQALGKMTDSDRYLLIECLLQCGELQRAGKLLESMPEGQENPEVNFYLGWYFCKLGKMEKSLEYYRKSAALDQRKSRCYWEMFQIELQTGTKEALSELSKILELPDKTDKYYKKARSYLKSNFPENGDQ